MSGKELFRVEKLPVLQNKTFSTKPTALASHTGDVVLVQDERTGLIYNCVFDPARLVYDHEYQNEQACSVAFRRHLEDVAGIITRHLRGQSLIEIGCGGGYFLEYLRSLGFAITGMDPAYEGSNPDVIKARLEESLGFSADAIVLRHVLEHIHDPFSFLSKIAAANGGKGSIYIEVPCFEWILKRRAWFDIYYEHVNYFRLSDFSRMFGRLHASGHIFGGQYLFVVADLASLRRPAGGPDDRVEMPRDFLAGIDRALGRARTRNGHQVVWGAGSKGVTFALQMRRAGLTIDEVIDINPAKQGRYLGVSGLKVSAPVEALARMSEGDTILVMNSNYLDEIVQSTANRYSYVTVDHDGTS